MLKVCYNEPSLEQVKRSVTVEYPVANEVCVNNQVAIYLSIYRYIYISIYLSIYLSVYLSIYVSVCTVEYPVVCVNNQVDIYLFFSFFMENYS